MGRLGRVRGRHRQGDDGGSEEWGEEEWGAGSRTGQGGEDSLLLPYAREHAREAVAEPLAPQCLSAASCVSLSVVGEALGSVGVVEGSGCVAHRWRLLCVWVWVCVCVCCLCLYSIYGAVCPGRSGACCGSSRSGVEVRLGVVRRGRGRVKRQSSAGGRSSREGDDGEEGGEGGREGADDVGCVDVEGPKERATLNFRVLQVVARDAEGAPGPPA
ncbi:hypothetical protein B0H15DRAFT_579856 [Mycena belliarum]|uniref:Uncharacterized protein n=1 Tax=Mycena belliarum TaxID=1033014 RepID=A0AAD6UIT3_9AGAR|nr:hypothetical protein B0H15DRAFT_579856 [Mycena belliae]